MTKNPRSEEGYSLVEVLMAMVILTIAIVPIVGIFDVPLRSSELSSDYDLARTFANQELEQAKSVSYDTLVENFPSSSSFDTYTNGSPRTSASQSAGSSFPGITYTITKQFVELKSNGSIGASSNEDVGLVKVTVTTTWDGTKTYSVTGLVSR